MKIGIIGAGNVGGTLARRLTAGLDRRSPWSFVDAAGCCQSAGRVTFTLSSQLGVVGEG